MNLSIIIAMIIAGILLIWIGVLLVQISRKLQNLIDVTRTSNHKLDTHMKAFSLMTKALGSIFRAIKSKN